MNYILFDDTVNPRLRPFTFTKPAANLRIGILTIREKWEHRLDARTSSAAHDYLNLKFPCVIAEDNVFINGTVLPSESLVAQVKSLEFGQQLMHGDTLIAFRTSKEAGLQFSTKPGESLITDVPKLECEETPMIIENTWDFFQKNDEALRQDFDLITAGRESAQVSDTNTLIGDQIFIEEGVKMECAVLNSTSGPIYIGKNAEVMEGTVVRGGLAMCEGAVLKLSSKVYGPTTIGPYSKVGGEVNNVVIMGYSNKGHDGFMGNSVIGEWCNLGADTNTSNLKNNYSNVRVWSYSDNDYVDTKNQFVGLTMGDHSKCGINTMFNTGTVVGVNANVFGGGFPFKFIPSYSWCAITEFKTYKLDKAFEVARSVCARRNVEFTEQDEAIMTRVFEMTASLRFWDA